MCKTIAQRNTPKGLEERISVAISLGREATTSPGFEPLRHAGDRTPNDLAGRIQPADRAASHETVRYELTPGEGGFRVAPSPTPAADPAIAADQSLFSPVRGPRPD